MGPSIVSEGPGHRFAGLANVLICFYRGTPTATALKERIAWIEKSIECYGKLGIFVVIPQSARGGLPDRDFRRESKRQTEKYREQILFSATVIESKTANAKVLRTFLRGMTVLARAGFPVEFFDDLEPAAKWIEPVAAKHGGPSVDELLEAVDALRAS